MILPKHYVRRCLECLHPVHVNLPPLQKRIVYVDQFAISDMMKALNPKTPAHRAGRVLPRWLELFRKLDRLTKLHLIVSPDSEFHRRESEAAPFYDELRRLYELLSGGLTFRDGSYIEQSQVRESLQQWLAGRTDHVFDLDIGQVVHGNVHGWRERVTISWNSRTPEEVIQRRRRLRATVSDKFANIFRTWQQEPLPFEERVAVELMGYGEALIQTYQEYHQRYLRIATGMESFNLESVLPPNAGLMFLLIRDVLNKHGYSREEMMPKTMEYLASDAMGRIPFLKIRARLFAALARQAETGRKHLPSEGFMTDVTMVSLLLPYCDAMLVDSGVAALAREAGLPEAAGLSGRIFSPKMLPNFMEYLDAIEATCSPEHRALVESIYGPKGAEPFETVFMSDLPE